MGEIISLSQFRKERIRGARRSRSSAKRVQYGLADLGHLDANVERVQYIAEFQSKKPDNSDKEPEDV